MSTSAVTASPPAPVLPFEEDGAYAEPLEPTSSETSVLTDVAAPGDAMGIIMFLVERSSQHSISQGELRIKETREQLQAEFEKLVKQLEEAARAAAEAKKKEDGGGFFSDLVSGISKIAGKVLGVLVEVAYDSIVTPVELTVSVAQDIAKGQNVLQGFRQQLSDSAKLDGVSKDFESFSEGAARFAYDCTEFLVKVQLSAAEAATSGKNLGEMLKNDAKELFDSFKKNILENPGLATVLTAVAVACAVLTCGAGTLLLVAVVLLVVLEVDRRTGFIADTVGEKAAPYVRLGMQVAASVCMGFGAAGAGGSTEGVVKALQIGTAALQGTQAVYSGVKTIIEGERQADAIDREADTLETLQAMWRLQRLLDQLIASLEEDSENQTRTREISADVVETQAAADQAVLIPA